MFGTSEDRPVISDDDAKMKRSTLASHWRTAARIYAGRREPVAPVRRARPASSRDGAAHEHRDGLSVRRDR